ncbi:glycerophosphodiester phosphodiesterase family protein [Roseinatronobacter bogoriensis]|uniref:Glycerophosphodiester phosphodiesterase n=1 Tax=Roseinatronobacter bogoriensis subsp. barguzinensis TaxID=441209 RepID=A0A2K8KD24_9RHOB|nr:MULTISPECIES: glycerophosphodiester phosphodiesterase family protein [Rhodobaca]ATX64658.1 glycerophosphodiester phosphodiesterase [Rhodobaca barguzinensis]MBB4209502.1 glycerophosphoryl diester phosphodiesterase [Rhodobaca bogoriensis DSM 18756]TDW35132.1 glycerophosphoryl diester phosphodiesterase [Rhodobaca barguzinensis]TDY66858.1 glycerophosphoryl diester phosphodiesterase [Rhodobaca bogoriensis DSM 18756]
MSNTFRRPEGRPLVYGHRGARGVLPENTQEGFSYLRAIGVAGVEIDVQNTADGVPVVIHDPLIPMQLARDEAGNWLDAPGPKIIEMSAEELRRYDVGRLRPDHAYGTRYPDQRARDGARVPLLSEFLEWAVKDPALYINIEIKSFAHRDDLGDPPRILAKTVLDALAHQRIQQPCVISSFDWRVLGAVRAFAPEVARGYLSYEQPGEECTIFDGSPWMDGLRLSDHSGSLPRLIAAQGAQCWCPYFRDLTPERLAQAHDLGLAVNVWTVNEVADMIAMTEMGVDGVITDYPERMLQLLGPEPA